MAPTADHHAHTRMLFLGEAALTDGFRLIGFETWADPGTFGPFRNGSGADFDSAGRLWGVLDLRLEADPPSAFFEIARYDDSGRLANKFVDPFQEVAREASPTWA